MTNPNTHNHYRNPSELRKIETAMAATINAAYAEAVHDKQAIEVIPSTTMKSPDLEHEAALALAKKRIGHLTGSLIVKQNFETGQNNKHETDSSDI